MSSSKDQRKFKPKSSRDVVRPASTTTDLRKKLHGQYDIMMTKAECSQAKTYIANRKKLAEKKLQRYATTNVERITQSHKPLVVTGHQKTRPATITSSDEDFEVSKKKTKHSYRRKTKRPSSSSSSSSSSPSSSSDKSSSDQGKKSRHRRSHHHRQHRRVSSSSSSSDSSSVSEDDPPVYSSPPKRSKDGIKSPGKWFNKMMKISGKNRFDITQHFLQQAKYENGKYILSMRQLLDLVAAFEYSQENPPITRDFIRHVRQFTIPSRSTSSTSSEDSINLQAWLENLELWQEDQSLEHELQLLYKTLGDHNTFQEVRKEAAVDTKVQARGSDVESRESIELRKQNEKLLEQIQSLRQQNKDLLQLQTGSPSSIEAFHARQFEWIRRQMGQYGITRLTKWFRKMDYANTGYISLANLTLAINECCCCQMQQEGVETLSFTTDAIRKVLSSKIGQNDRKEYDYQQILQLIDSSAGLLPEEFTNTRDITTILSELDRTFQSRKLSVGEIAKPFHQRDFNADGVLSYATFFTALKTLNVQITRSDENLIVERFDPRKEGFINYPRFLHAVNSKTRAEDPRKCQVNFGSMSRDMIAKFQEKCESLDYKKKGWVPRTHVNRLLAKIFKKELDTTELHQLLSKFDLDHDGRFWYAEFLATLEPQMTEIYDPADLIEKFYLLLKASCNNRSETSDLAEMLEKFEKLCLRYDQDERGILSSRDFKKVLVQMQKTCSDTIEFTSEEMHQLKNHFRSSKDQVMNYVDLIQHVFDTKFQGKSKAKFSATLKKLVEKIIKHTTYQELRKQFEKHQHRDLIHEKQFITIVRHSSESSQYSKTALTELAQFLSQELDSAKPSHLDLRKLLKWWKLQYKQVDEGSSSSNSSDEDLRDKYRKTGLEKQFYGICKRIGSNSSTKKSSRVNSRPSSSIRQEEDEHEFSPVRAFAYLDRYDRGSLTIEELEAAFDDHFIATKKKEVAKLLEKISDNTSKKRITFDQFEHWSSPSGGVGKEGFRSR